VAKMSILAPLIMWNILSQQIYFLAELVLI